MRLSKIKLAGFKSFVDPTTVTFPSNLVGVVGPNGCGKSNVIDAVRWVMGESSASRLRGDSITDVIFNGSSARKPVGAASVELLFDNTDTTLEGQYAKYAEIGIRREVTRDGISSYYLNGTRCRRKDITGIFLGTGSGPRSYSIIEQGMISRLIDAKPEDMRVFLEEAAGISKYKERRRETSNRIRHTKENLDRLRDVLEEVEKQIKHLDRQAKAAERFRRYRAEERRTGAELLAMRAMQLDARSEETQSRLSERKTRLESAVADQRRIESGIEDLRQKHSEQNDAFNKVQGQFYKVGSNISRLEQSIEHARDLRKRQHRDLEQAIEGAREIAELIGKDQSEIAQLEVSLSELTPGLEQARRVEQASQESLLRAEEALAQWQQHWNDYLDRYSESNQQQSVEHTRSEQIESRLQGMAERRRRLDEASAATAVGDIAAKFAQLTDQEAGKRQRKEEFERHLVDIASKVRTLREQDLKLTRLVDERRNGLQAAQSKLASLDALQKAALGEGDEGVQQWLQGSGLAENRRVAQALNVEGDWERAVETVLGDYLQAICVSDIESVTESIAALKSGHITLLDENGSAPASTNGATLADKVSGAPAPVTRLLARVRIAETLNAALSIRELLDDETSVVTVDGIWMGRNWLRVARDKDEKAGILSREHEMRRLKNELREIQMRYDSARKLLHDGRLRQTQLEERRETIQQDAAVLFSEYSELKAELDSTRYRLDQNAARQKGIADEYQELDEEHAQAGKQLQESRMQLEQAVVSLTSLDTEKKSLEERREQLRGELERVRAQAEQDRRTVQEIAIQFESRRTSKESAAQSLLRMQSQMTQFSNREQELQEQLRASEAPLQQNDQLLEEQLAVRVNVERELAEARKLVEHTESQLRELDESRLTVEQSVEAARQAVTEIDMAMQELRVRRENVSEQIANTDFEMETLVGELDEAATIDSWEDKLQKLTSRIDRLGPINLAAIDEFKEHTERKQYLDAQLDDLNSALETLENAIRKIDRETRSRFRDTFTRVDAGFKRLFPMLFGGGHAYLEMTGEDLLTAGITVMARPPGKRNSTINLLSGGEKALTAVALVFAIFELNPAPFCLLDEVDAPLDDANVGRFCDIVRAMSEKVQFIFITHNKVTMEMARQLTGVTMQEPGVSRLVSVDLDEAVKMAAS